MKKCFYIYWVWFLSLMAFQLSGLTAPLWVSETFMMLMNLNFMFLTFGPLWLIYDRINGDVQNRGLEADIDRIYLEGILVSYMPRIVLYIASKFGMENNWEMVCVVGFFMLGYYIFEIRQKIIAIEKRLL